MRGDPDWASVRPWLAESGHVFIEPGHDPETSGFWLGCGLADELWTKADIERQHGKLHPLVLADGTNLDPDVVEAQWRQYAQMIRDADAQGHTRPWPPHSPMPAWWPLPES